MISTSFRHPLLLFRSMLRARSSPDSITLLSVLSASARVSDLDFGTSSHLLFFKLGLPFTHKCFNAAIHLYAKCGRIADARRVFVEMPAPNAVSWAVLLSGTVNVEGLLNARKLFDFMPERNEASWTLMVGSYIEAGMPREALSLLSRMIFYDKCTNNLSYIGLCSLLSSCSQAGDLTTGRWIHTHVAKSAFFDDEEDVMVTTALIDMYGKCGKIATARVLFGTMSSRNLVAWNAMLGGLSMHGLAYEALDLFARMVEEELQMPDNITFVNLLSACSRCGLIEEGRKLFDGIELVYGLRPKIEHYACMVDLLGRAGKLEEAEGLIREMPIAPNEVVLGSLMGSCALHGKLELGRRLMCELVEMDPGNTEYHALLSNLYSSNGRYSEADGLWQDIKRKKVGRKGPGMSYIEVDGNVHRFSVGDTSHPQTREVYVKLDEMVKRLRLIGYAPNAASQGSRVECNYSENGDGREEREQALFSHSERLAVAFGLISTRRGLPLRIFKNLRICCDCHSVMKLLSRIYGREIIIRDRNRFHCFKQGMCSCSDYW